MKKFLLLSLSLIGIAGLASASPVTCSVLMSPGTSGNSTGLCTVTAPVGSYISALTLTGTDDYTGLQSGSPTVTFTGNISQTGGLTTPFTDPTFCAVITSGSSHVACQFTTNPSGTVTNSNTAITTYQVSLVNITNTVSGGSVTGDSITLSLDYATATIPTGGVPEPATMGLMGSALVGLGFLARRKK